MKFLIAMLLLWIAWSIGSRQWRRWFIYPLIGITVVLTAISPFGVELGLRTLLWLVPTDSGELADAIVVLGRGKEFRESRVAETWKLWQFERAPQIFASGMGDAQTIVRELEERGVPSKQVSGEECSQNTYENAQFSSVILKPQKVRKIVLVTDPAHVLRAFLTFQSFGFHVIPHFSSPSTPYRANHLLREYLGLGKYIYSKKIDLHATAISNTVPTQITQKISDWNCQIHISFKRITRLNQA